MKFQNRVNAVTRRLKMKRSSQTIPLLIVARRHPLALLFGVCSLLTVYAQARPAFAQAPFGTDQPRTAPPQGGFGGGGDANNEKSSLALVSEGVLVKGFPALLQLQASGRQRFPKLFLTSLVGSLKATFIEKKTGKSWEIFAQDNRGMNMTMGGPFGTMDGTAYMARRNSLDLDAGNSAQATFDFSSLSFSDRLLTLSDLPAGNYQLQITTNQISSPPVDIEIREPTPDESKFLQELELRWSEHLQELRNRKMAVYISRGKRLRWPEFVRYPVDTGDRSALSAAASRQLAPYVLLTEILRETEPLTQYPLAKLEAFQVAPYLEGEKLILKYELLHEREDQKQAEQVKQKVAQDFPGLLWRVDAVNQGQGLLRSTMVNPPPLKNVEPEPEND
jgi:hypothetical protein